MDKTAGFLDTLKRLFTQTERVFAVTNARYGQWNGEKSQGLEMCCIFRKLCHAQDATKVARCECNSQTYHLVCVYREKQWKSSTVEWKCFP